MLSNKLIFWEWWEFFLRPKKKQNRRACRFKKKRYRKINSLSELLKSEPNRMETVKERQKGRKYSGKKQRFRVWCLKMVGLGLSFIEFCLIGRSQGRRRAQGAAVCVEGTPQHPWDTTEQKADAVPHDEIIHTQHPIHHPYPPPAENYLGHGPPSVEAKMACSCREKVMWANFAWGEYAHSPESSEEEKTNVAKVALTFRAHVQWPRFVTHNKMHKEKASTALNHEIPNHLSKPFHQCGAWPIQN